MSTSTESKQVISLAARGFPYDCNTAKQQKTIIDILTEMDELLQTWKAAVPHYKFIVDSLTMSVPEEEDIEGTESITH